MTAVISLSLISWSPWSNSVYLSFISAGIGITLHFIVKNIDSEGKYSDENSIDYLLGNISIYTTVCLLALLFNLHQVNLKFPPADIHSNMPSSSLTDFETVATRIGATTLKNILSTDGKYPIKVAYACSSENINLVVNIFYKSPNSYPNAKISGIGVPQNDAIIYIIGENLIRWDVSKSLFRPGAQLVIYSSVPYIKNVSKNKARDLVCNVSLSLFTCK